VIKNQLIFIFIIFSIVFGNVPNAENCPTGIEFINAVLTSDESSDFPISFIPNYGQLNKNVDFVANKGNHSYWFTSEEIVFERIIGNNKPQEVIRLNFVDGNESNAEGVNQISGENNFISGSNPNNWITNVPNYQGVLYRNIYNGIDAVFSSNSGFIKSDFIVQPNENVSELKLKYDGAESVRINNKGELVLQTTHGEFIDGTPIAYQIINNGKEYVNASYELSDSDIVRFSVSDYNSNYPLIIDPFLKWSSFVGGDGWDDGMTIEYTSDGSIVAIGTTDDHEFPHTTSGVYQESHGGPTPEVQYGYDIIVTKISADGTTVDWSTFIGGSGIDIVYESAIDASNNIYIVGETTSTDLPTSSGAHQSTYGGGANDAFLLILSSNGTVLNYGTYLGGSLEDRAYGITLDGSGGVYISGETTSTDFPITSGTYQSVKSGSFDSFISHINPIGGGGADLLHSTYLGGSNVDLGRIILQNSSGNVVLTGITNSTNMPTAGNPYDTSHNGANDIFIAELNSTLSTLNYGTYLGSSGNDYGHGIAETSTGEIIVTGYTASTGFPTTVGSYDETFNGDHDATLSKLSLSGNGAGDLLYSTFLGGSGLEWSNFNGVGTSGIRMNNIAIGCGDMIYLNIGTTSTDLPTTANAYDKTFNTGAESWYGDRAILKIGPNGTGSSDLLYSTYLGSTHRDHNDVIIIKDDNESIAITAGIFGWDFPTTTGVFQETHGNDGLGDYQEDAIIATLNFIDYGDAPNTYGTIRTSNGPRHILGKLRLGSEWDAESDGSPSGNALGDDNLSDSSDDEDGIQLDASYIANTQGSITANITGGSGWLAGWFDWDGDGIFETTTERAVWQAVNQGNNIINFSVPSNAQAGTSYARFRLAQTSSNISEPTSSDFVCGGEVEDYQILVSNGLLDFGDLPDSPYKTLLSNDGARHMFDGVTYLGNPGSGNTDTEPDGQPNSSATGDDINGNNDDDGVVFNSALIPGQPAQITVSAAAPGYLNAWIDYNDDGDFSDVGEQIANDTQLNVGNNQIQIAIVPLDATGAIKSRFRFTSGQGEATVPYGLAPNGEVEDYALSSIGDFVWEDGYNGKQNPAEDGLNDVVIFLLDSGLNPIAFTATKNHPTTSEPGWYGFPGLSPGDYYVQFNLLGGYLFTLKDAGTDDDKDSDADESTGLTDMISIAAGIEEHSIDAGMKQQLSYDFGDLPEVYKTYIANDGPGHVIDGTTYLGSIGPDTEINGQPNSSATGDDNNGTDDEDGITFIHPLHPGSSADIEVISSTGSAYLNAWIDFNNNSDFSDPGEQIATNSPLNVGNNIINISSVPQDANGQMHSRFRLSSEQGLEFFGPAPDGEVEDYVLGAIGDFVWVDADGDGIQDFGELGLPDVTIHLLDSGYSPVLDANTNPIITTTNASGFYEFPGLPPDEYCLEFVLPSGYTFSSQDQGGDENIDSDADPSTGRTSIIELSTYTTLSFSNIDVGAVGNVVMVTTANDIADAPDTTSIGALLGDIGADGKISLREAISACNNTSGLDTIKFAIGTGLQTINVASDGLPVIHDPLYLDATTQPGYSGDPIIQLDGSATNVELINGIYLRTSNSTVKGFIIHSFYDEGIESDGSTGYGDNNIIENNWVGISSTGSAAGNGDVGILITVNADGNIIRNNISSSNGSDGIEISNNSNNNWVWGNNIGLGTDGSTIRNNSVNGISIGGDGNIVGTDGNSVDDVLERNIISGYFHAIYVTSTSTGDIIAGNYIGTDITGTQDRGTFGDGIFAQSATNLTINDNVISGNSDGIEFENTTLSNIYGNYIGTNASGTDKLGNSSEGIILGSSSNNNTIGGTVSYKRNIISGNSGPGVFIFQSSNNQTQGNYIGTNVIGSLGLDNDGGGITIGSSSSNNTIGGLSSQAANLIAFNEEEGVTFAGNAGTGNAVLGNSIHSNNNVGIDLGDNNGPTPNDLDDTDTGGNNLQNYPVLSSAVTDETNMLKIYASLNSTPSTSFRIEFFSNSIADPSGYGEGETFLGDTTVITDTGGNVTFSKTFYGFSIPAGYAISSTATDQSNNTSEFSAVVITQRTTASIGDYVWIDTDEDGVQDGGESGLINVTVNLHYSGGALAQTSTTNSAGLYLFSNVVPGDYYLDFILPANYSFSPQDAGADGVDSDADPLTGQTSVTTLSAGESDMTWDAGMYTVSQASIGDYVWIDTDEDGVQDGGEIGIENVTVNLYKKTYGSVQNYNQSIASSTDDVEEHGPEGQDYYPGYMYFNSTDLEIVEDIEPTTSGTQTIGLRFNNINIPQGSKIVNAYVQFRAISADSPNNNTDPANLLIKAQASDNAPSFPATDWYLSNAVKTIAGTNWSPTAWTTGNDYTTPSIVTIAQEIINRDLWSSGNSMAFIITGTGSRSAESWDNSGSNPPILVIEYSQPIGATLVGTTTTNTSGAYSFTGLDPDDYYVEFVLPGNYEFSPKDQGGNDAIDSDANGSTGETIFTTLIGGENDITWDAGMYTNLQASIGDYVWNDIDADGIQDGDEEGLGNITVKLYFSGGGVAQETTTNPSGIYSFTNVDPGDYYLEFVKPEDYSFSYKDRGGLDQVDSDVDILTGQTNIIVITEGQNLNNVDVGMFQDMDHDHIPDDVEGTDDRDNDGIPNNQDYDPAGYIYYEITGEIISGGLIEVSGPGVVTIVEDGSTGYYEFWTDGTAGTYTITFTEPVGYELSTICPSSDPPPFDPTSGPIPTFLGFGEDGSTGYLIDNTCIANPYYLTFELEAGDPFIFNNNFPLKPTGGSGTVAPISYFQEYNGLINYAMTAGTFRDMDGSTRANAASLRSTAPGDLTLPTGAIVQKALLYWGGSSSTPDNTVTFDGQTIVSTRDFVDGAFTGEEYFGHFADVTTLVLNQTPGTTKTYIMEDLTVDNTGYYWTYFETEAVWSLVVVYIDPNITLNHTVYVYDGWEMLWNGTGGNPNPQSTRLFNLNGFTVGSTGYADITAMIYEGDSDLVVGESISVNSNIVSSGNTHASTSNVSGVGDGFSPYGLDVDRFDASPYVSPGDNSMTFEVSTADDMIHISTVVLRLNTAKSTIGNYVWEDENSNGVQDDNPSSGIANVTINLLEAGLDETFNTGDDITFPAEVTNSNGEYTFTELAAGKYRVSVDKTSVLAEDPSLIYATYDYDNIVTENYTELILAEAESQHFIDFGYSDTPLPVTLSEFKAELVNDGVYLQWTTESEVENQGFIIERREESSTEWREIANYINNSGLRGHGTVTYQNDYEYTDKLVQAGKTYEYRLGDVDYNTAITYHNKLTIIIKVTSNVAIPKEFKLKAAYPNPFNPSTRIEYALPEESYVRLSIFNISGTLVKTLVNRREAEGNKQAFWNGQDENGRNVSGGIYLYRIETDEFIATRKMLLLR